MLQLKPLTLQHLGTARKMPAKKLRLWINEKANRKEDNKLKRERRDIAAYYRAVRNSTEEGYGRRAASIAHRYAIVITGTEARVRLQNMELAAAS